MTNWRRGGAWNTKCCSVASADAPPLADAGTAATVRGPGLPRPPAAVMMSYACWRSQCPTSAQDLDAGLMPSIMTSSERRSVRSKAASRDCSLIEKSGKSKHMQGHPSALLGGHKPSTAPPATASRKLCTWQQALRHHLSQLGLP